MLILALITLINDENSDFSLENAKMLPKVE